LHILPKSPFAISLLFVAQPHKQAPIHSHARNCSLQTAEMSVQRLHQGLDDWGIAASMSGTGREWFCDEYNDLNVENRTFGIHLELLESLNLLQPGRV